MDNKVWLLGLLLLVQFGCGGGGGSPPPTPTDPCAGSGLLNDPTNPVACAVPDPYGATCPNGTSVLVASPTSTFGSQPGWWEGEISAARDPERERYFVATINAVTVHPPGGTPCVTEKQITLYQSDGGGSWQPVPGNDSLPRPVVVTGPIVPPSDPYSHGVVATDPWLEVGRDGNLFFSLAVISGSSDCNTPWPSFTPGWKAGQEDPTTPESEAERLEEIQLWMLPNTPGARLTKIALDPDGATAIDGQKTSQISRGTINETMDHPRMAASPARDQVVVSFLAAPGPDYLRTVMKQPDGTWSVVPTSLQSVPDSFTFPHMTFDPDGNLYLAYSNGTTDYRIHKYAWQNNDWVLLQQSSLPLPSGYRAAGTSFWDLPNSGDSVPVDATPAMAIDRIGAAQQPIIYVAYALWDTKGTAATGDDEPRVMLSAANVNDITRWMTPHVVTTAISTFAPSLSFAGKANVLDVLVHELDGADSDPAIVMRQRRYWASDFGREQASLAVGVPARVSEIPTRSPRVTREVFFGEYQGLTGKGRVAIAAVPTRVGDGDADLHIATINDRCQNTVRELTSASHPDTVWDCDCDCGGSQTSLTGCLPASVSSAATACASICRGSDCGMAVSCPAARQCAPLGTGRVRLGSGCQDTYGPWIGPPPSLFADYFADAVAGSSAQFVLNGESAQTSLSGSVAVNVSDVPPVAGTQIEISRLDLRPASFGVGGFLGATIRNIRMVHVERFYGTFVDAQHFTIPAHTAELVARLVIDPDGPDWLTGDPTTTTLGIDNDGTIDGTLDLAANTITLTIVAGGGGNSVNATFVGTIQAAPVDSDGDGFVDSLDNCPRVYNPDQADAPPVFAPLGASLVTRCAPGDLVAIPFPGASDACTPDEVDVEGVILSVDGVPLGSPIPLAQVPASLPSGMLDVEWTATDGNGLVSTLHQQVEVVTGPYFTVVPPDFTTSACLGVSVGQAFARSDCPGTVTMSNNAPVKFPLGTTIVTHTATDQQGHARAATQRVTVLLGDDPVCCPAGTHVVAGTSNNDVLNGTAGADCILGRGGQDTINGFAGNDFISGGDGDDVISGGLGNDMVYGGSGQDVMSGNDGDDMCYGGDGDDTLAGGVGDDLLRGGQGQDLLQGQDGNDRLFGDDGDDSLQGGAGNDDQAGGAGNDACDPGLGVDTFALCELGAPDSCADGVRGGTETGVDCGGGCPPCATGGACVGAGDCLSSVCSDGTCRMLRDGIAVARVVETDWGAGYCVHLDATNLAALPTSNWTATIDTNQATIFTSWNASLSGNGGVITVTPTLSSSQVVWPSQTDSSVGFCANRTVPANKTFAFVTAASASY